MEFIRAPSKFAAQSPTSCNHKQHDVTADYSEEKYCHATTSDVTLEIVV